MLMSASQRQRVLSDLTQISVGNPEAIQSLEKISGVLTWGGKTWLEPVFKPFICRESLVQSHWLPPPCLPPNLSFTSQIYPADLTD